MFSWLLRKLGYYRVDYGFSCGRHWMSIDGHFIAQTPGDIWLRDEDVHRVVYETIDHGKHWSVPGCSCISECRNPDFRWCEGYPKPRAFASTTGTPK